MVASISASPYVAFGAKATRAVPKRGLKMLDLYGRARILRRSIES
jgi:hypothetical protein